MIFLLKDTTFRVELNDQKALKWYENHEGKVKAVLIDCATRLHSDCYAIITAENFRTKIKPFSIFYSIALYEPDSPLDPVNGVVSREIRISTPMEFYQVAALVYQICRCESIGDVVSMGRRQVAITAFTIKNKDGEFEWDSDTDLIKFINKYGLICDTDTFLDASMTHDKSKEMENGSYITRFNRHDGTHQLTYYYHERKFFLCLDQGKWSLNHKSSAIIQSFMHGRFNTIYGFCLNGTGLIYLASTKVAVNILEAQSCSVMIRQTHIDDESADETEEMHRMIFNDETYADYTMTYEGYNTADILYMALYLPQIWDLEKYLLGDVITNLFVMFLQMKHYEKGGQVNLNRGKDDEAIQVDLFAIFAAIFNESADDISFDD